MEELANLDASALDDIFNNFYDKAEYGDSRLQTEILGKLILMTFC
jgi:hypothetical protein